MLHDNWCLLLCSNIGIGIFNQITWPFFACALPAGDLDLVKIIDVLASNEENDAYVGLNC